MWERGGGEGRVMMETIVTQHADKSNDIGRNFLLGNRKKIAKFLMRTFTCRSTFLYALNLLFHHSPPLSLSPTPLSLYPPLHTPTLLSYTTVIPSGYTPHTTPIENSLLFYCTVHINKQSYYDLCQLRKSCSEGGGGGVLKGQ